MKKLKLEKVRLKLFLSNLRKEDKEELDFFFKTHTVDDFISICLELKSTTDFLADDNLNPIALGGICPFKNKQGQVWLLCSKDAVFHKKELYKYVKNKIISYQNSYDYLFNQIYKSNFKALKWLRKLGFQTKKLNEDFKMFYFKKENK